MLRLGLIWQPASLERSFLTSVFLPAKLSQKIPSKLSARLSVCATNASSMVTCHGIGIIVTVGYIMY